MFFRQITDPKLAQYAYLVGCQASGEAVIIDPLRDIDQYTDLAAAEGLRIVAATETHIHADFVSGVREFAERGVRAYLSGEGGDDWQYAWPEKGEYDCVIIRDSDTFDIGTLTVARVASASIGFTLIRSYFNSPNTPTLPNGIVPMNASVTGPAPQAPPQ